MLLAPLVLVKVEVVVVVVGVGVVDQDEVEDSVGFLVENAVVGVAVAVEVVEVEIVAADVGQIGMLGLKNSSSLTYQDAPLLQFFSLLYVQPLSMDNHFQPFRGTCGVR